jgi:dienelactone hydrolase
LKTVIDLIRSGRQQSAQEILRSMLKADVHDIQAWFWYVETCTTVNQRIQTLEACSICNPDNSQVKSVLAALRKQQPQPSENSKIEAKPLDKGAFPGGVASPLRKPVVMGQRDEGKPWAGAAKPAKKPGHTVAWMMWLVTGGLIVLIAYLAFTIINSAPADPGSHRFTQPIEYYLYVPKGYTVNREWPLFIGVHGSGGTGLDCWNLWQPYAEREGFILLCPSLSDSNGGWYQDEGEARTWAVITQVTSQYAVKPRYFLAGFSAGAQFVQGFCFKYPGAVQAVAVLSAGNYYPPSAAAGGIPFLIVIGDSDDPAAINGSSQLAGNLAANGSGVSYWLLPGVGHQVTNRTRQLTIDFFRASFQQGE